MKIRIKKAGKLIEKEAEVIDKIDNEGHQYSIALCGGNVYQVIDRDFYGAIYGNQAAAALGRIKSDKKAASSRENGKKGGRPKKQKPVK